LHILDIAAACLIVSCPTLVCAQTASLRVEVRSDSVAIADASVVVNGAPHRTDDRGVVALDLPPGPIQIVAVKEGREPASVTLELRAGEARTVTIDLQRSKSTSPLPPREPTSAWKTSRCAWRCSTGKRSKRS
jgi:hypothetical protein